MGNVSVNNPLLSVCIPVYNGEEYIKFAIESVLGQNFTDFELIIVDNKSTDNTLSVVKGYKDDRIKIIENESNIGLVPNWNKAVNSASGKYIKILPHDDFIYPGCLKLQCDILEKDVNKNISLVCGRKNIINDNGKVLFNRGFSKKEIEVSGIYAINKTIRAGGNILGEGAAVMFRREIIEKTGLFSSDIFYVLDLDLWFRILLYGNLYVLPDLVSSFRVSKSSASVKVVDQQRKDMADFAGKIYSNKSFKLSWLNYKIGLLTAYILTQAKKILYKYIA